MDREEKGSEMSHGYMGLCGKSGCTITSQDDPGNEHRKWVQGLALDHPEIGGRKREQK